MQKITSFMVGILLFFHIDAIYADPVAVVNLQFNAILIERGCTVVPASQNISVLLGKWPTRMMKDSGDATMPVGFSIQLQDCTAQKVSVGFQGITDQLNPQLLRLSSDSTATHVAIQILDENRKIIPFTDTSTPLDINNIKNVNLKFFAQYVATGKVTAGTANSVATFYLNYD